MHSVLTRKTFITAIVASLGIIAVACGGGDDEPAPTATSQPTQAVATATSPAAPPTSSGLTGDVTSGEALFTSATCSACHSTGDNPIVGPGLKGIKDRAASLGGDSYIAESITNPNAVIAEGFAPVMSSFAHLEDQEVADLVAYLNTLD